MENENNNGIISRETIDQVASWFSATVSTAFFSSLERFSCVNLAIEDDDDDDGGDEAPNRPLTLTTTTTAVDHTTEPPNDVAELPV